MPRVARYPACQRHPEWRRRGRPSADANGATATCNTSQQKSIARYTVVGGAINPPTVRIPPNVSQDRPVQIAPTLTAPRSVALDVIRTGAVSGAAFVDPATVTETTNVCLEGTEQTEVGFPKNMQLREKVSGDVVVNYDDFTVCAHPTGTLVTYDSILTAFPYGGSLNWGVKYNLAFTSDSLRNYLKTRKHAKVLAETAD